MVKVAGFIDELLEKVYHLPPFYRVEEPSGLIGHLLVGLAPHTSAGVLARLVGFSRANVGYAHPFFHAAKRRNCFHGDTGIEVYDGERVEEGPDPGLCHRELQSLPARPRPARHLPLRGEAARLHQGRGHGGKCPPPADHLGLGPQGPRGSHPVRDRPGQVHRRHPRPCHAHLGPHLPAEGEGARAERG